jgi:hypothetical protein
MSMPAGSRPPRNGWGPGSWERRGHALLPMPEFLRRVAFNLVLGLVFIGVSLLAGMWGYAHYEGMNLTESFLNASMILSGMGPAAALQTEGGKWFAGCYALYSGLAVLAAAGVVFAPLLHRLLHHFHADEQDFDSDDLKDIPRK